MTDLTERIAAEHLMTGTSGCTCGQMRLGQSYPGHVATVTETAVREQIAADIDATWEAFALPLPVSTATPDQAKFYRFGYLWAAETVKGTP